MSEPVHYTPTETKILKALSDGQYHCRYEILGLISNNEEDMELVADHITRMRRKMRPRGEDVICSKNPEGRRGIYYRQVRLMASAQNGYR
jgi:DNA-binding response OmpR family regulator